MIRTEEEMKQKINELVDKVNTAPWDQPYYWCDGGPWDIYNTALGIVEQIQQETYAIGEGHDPELIERILRWILKENDSIFKDDKVIKDEV